MHKSVQCYVLMILFAALTMSTAFSQGASTTAPAASPPATGATTPAPAPPPAVTAPAEAPRAPFQTTPTVETAPAQPVNPDTLEVSISFTKAELSSVLSFLSLASGVPIVVDADVKGTVTITSVRQVSLTLAYDVINSALRVRGYTMVGTLRDKVIRVVPLKRALAERPVVKTGANAAEIGTSDTVITQVIPLQFLNATKLKDELKVLAPDDQSNLFAENSTNMLVLTDTEANVKRMVQIINLLDKDTSSIMDVEVYKCKYASAASLIASVSQVFGLTTATSATAQPAGGGPGQNRGPGGGNNAGNQPAIRTDEGVLSLQGELHLASDDRTNSILISAAKAKIGMVLTLVNKLDVDTNPEVHAKIFALHYADATTLANQLNSLFQQPPSQTSSNNPFLQRLGLATNTTDPNAYAGLKRNVVVADVRTNSVVVTATEQNMQQFESMIKSIDTPNSLSEIARTFRLKYATAATLAQTLNTLFNQGVAQRTAVTQNYNQANASTISGDPIASLRNITVVSDTKTNSLVITAAPQAFPMIENLIAQLDQRSDQVFIEVAIVDVTLTDETKFGIEWQYTRGIAPNGTSPANSFGTNFGLANPVNGWANGLQYSVLSNNLSALLSSLTTKSNVKVYSTPSITTADNVAAKISIGKEIPYVSSTESTNVGIINTSTYVDVSITLNVTPHVNITSNLIGLDLDQTINDVQNLNQNPPIITQREAKTSVMVTDGQTIVIGGMIQENSDKEHQDVPLLSRIPLLGSLFKTRDNSHGKTELMVFLTPHILHTEDNISDITNKEQKKLSDPSIVAPLQPDKPGLSNKTAQPIQPGK